MRRTMEAATSCAAMGLRRVRRARHDRNAALSRLTSRRTPPSMRRAITELAMRRALALSLLLLPMLSPNLSRAQDAGVAATSAAANAMPPPPPWLEGLDALYDARIRVAGLDDRMFAPEQWWNVAAPLATGARGFQV